MEGDLLSWIDVLHDGPVPGGRRTSCGCCAPPSSQTRAGRRRMTRSPACAARDERLSRALVQGEPVVLWFEHDLFDQLQLLQVLDAIGEEGDECVELILVGSFPGRPALRGPGRAEPVRAAEPVAAAGAAAARTAGSARRAWALPGRRSRCPGRGGARAGGRPASPGGGAGAPPRGRARPDGLGRTERELLAAVGAGRRHGRGRRSPTPRARSGRRSWATRVGLRAAGRDGGAATGAGRGRGGPDRPGHPAPAHGRRARRPGREGLLEASRRRRAMARRRPARPRCIRERPERVTFVGTRCFSGSRPQCPPAAACAPRPPAISSTDAMARGARSCAGNKVSV